ncbi:MAG TPA: DUF3043 domain-containing protein [Jiangellaceae bacterium]|nr:DUF3043 domain-containing protein [Jiangellaceae bacterium]
MFRRRNPEDSDTTTLAQPADDAAAAAQGKGRPTPKRRQAEQARKERVKPPVTRREQVRRDRERMKATRARQREGMAKGDERYFVKRDQGEVRRFIRDYVDSRRTISEFFLPLVLIILVLSMIGNVQIQVFSTLFMFATMLVVIFDLVLINRRVKREIRKRFPDDDQRGHGLYAIARATQIRKLRLPKPNVRPGDTV